jgi:hypothetical protein
MPSSNAEEERDDRLEGVKDGDVHQQQKQALLVRPSDTPDPRFSQNDPFEFGLGS